jgi:hypothetical protein
MSQSGQRLDEAEPGGGLNRHAVLVRRLAPAAMASRAAAGTLAIWRPDLQDDGPAAVDNHAIVQMLDHGASQHDGFDVATDALEFESAQPVGPPARRPAR